MNECQVYKLANTIEGQQNYRKINNELRRATKRAREQWWNNICKDIEEQQRRGNYLGLYTKIRFLTQERKSEDSQMINVKNGMVITPDIKI